MEPQKQIQTKEEKLATDNRHGFSRINFHRRDAENAKSKFSNGDKKLFRN
ncbi:MAG: hypothetical protein PHX21_08465 [bacterium]|nr:hypothetical protein [bacterium]